MDVTSVDPRVDVRWELLTRDYRVVFWRQPQPVGDTPRELVGWHGSPFDLTGAEDVHEVIAWADAEARTRESTYILFAKVDRGNERGFLWLAGVDPTAHPERANFTRAHPG